MTEQKAAQQTKAVLVVGGGISGITVAVETAEAGWPVVLIERGPSLGGRVAANHLYFPKMCPPPCGLEINYQRLRKRPEIRVLTLAEVTKLEGGTATISVKPRYVNEKCTACGKCAEVCPVERPNPHNAGLDTTKAAYLPHASAYPQRFAIDMSVCKGAACNKCAEACAYGAIELDMKERTVEVPVGAAVVATGWLPYDAKRLDVLGFGVAKNVITNAIMERLAAPAGPTGGKILRPSDGQPPKRVVFVQCAGSRDRLHLPYCSAVCCTASLKQAGYVRALYPDAELTMCYIDVRTPGRLEDFYVKARDEHKITMLKGKVAKITEDAAGTVTLEVEDVLGGTKRHLAADLVVLATGMPPATPGGLPGVAYDANGFATGASGQVPVFAAGCAKKPVDVAGAVQDATGVALKAIQALVRS
ncbi:MAG TPA: CoB--CoM heterodisulfide reductase iron-sulfur subunit A family protein [bacterium]